MHNRQDKPPLTGDLARPDDKFVIFSLLTAPGKPRAEVARRK
jgi:hypothetical protein